MGVYDHLVEQDKIEALKDKIVWAAINYFLTHQQGHAPSELSKAEAEDAVNETARALLVAFPAFRDAAKMK